MPINIIDPPLSELDQLPTPLTPGEQKVLEYFSSHLGKSWELYVQPHLNGYRPDFVILNPKVGIVVVEVKDWDFAAVDYFYENNEDGIPRLYGIIGGEKVRLSNQDPVSKIESYKRAISSLFCTRLSKESYGCITTIVAFPFQRRVDVEQLLQPARTHYGHDRFPRQNTLLTLDEISKGEIILRAVLPVAYVARDIRFNDNDGLDLRHWLVEPEFSVEQRRPLPTLDPRQEFLVKSRTESRYRKIRGSAGSGKSVVIAARAASLALQRKSVLIVTFNITLMSYLRDYVVRIDRSRVVRDNIDYYHFHGLARFIAEQTGNFDKYDLLWKDKRNIRYVLEKGLAISVMRWCEELSDSQKYDAIFVDEGQDFRKEWWIALRSALKPDGEMLLAVDRAQNIYGVENWADGGLEGTGLSSSWYELPTSYRMPDELIDLMKGFAECYLPQSAATLPMPANRSLSFSDNHFGWTQCAKGDAVEACMSAILNILKSCDDVVSMADLCFITDDIEIGRSVADELFSRLGVACVHTFGNSGGNTDEEQRISESRKGKLAFRKGDGRAKVTTIQSFKGWESSVLVLYISEAENEEQLSLIYTGMTRLKSTDHGSRMEVVSSVDRLEPFGRRWPNFMNYSDCVQGIDGLGD